MYHVLWVFSPLLFSRSIFFLSLFQDFFAVQLISSSPTLMSLPRSIPSPFPKTVLSVLLMTLCNSLLEKLSQPLLISWIHCYDSNSRTDSMQLLCHLGTQCLHMISTLPLQTTYSSEIAYELLMRIGHNVVVVVVAFHAKRIF